MTPSLSLVRRAWAQFASTALGVWLMAAPAVLDYAGLSADVHRIAGPVAASFAFVAIWEHLRPLRWANVAFGVLLVGAPWALGSSTVATANGVVVGLLLAGLAFLRGEVRKSYGGGWSSLWTGDVAGEGDAG